MKQVELDNEVICFGNKFKLSVDLIQLFKEITVWGFTLHHCHKLFLELYTGQFTRNSALFLFTERQMNTKILFDVTRLHVCGYS